MGGWVNYLSEDQGRPSGQDQDPIDQQMRPRSNKREMKHQNTTVQISFNSDVKETVGPHLIKIWGGLNRRDIRRKIITNHLKISKFTRSNVQFGQNIVIQ